MDFFKKLFGSSDDVSSKRFISIFSFALFVAIIICDLCGVKISEYLTYLVISLVMGTQTMTMFKKPSQEIPDDVAQAMKNIIVDNVTKVKGFQNEENEETKSEEGNNNS